MIKKEHFDWRLYCAIPGKTKGRFTQEEIDVIIKGILPPFNYGQNRISFGLPNASALFIGNAYKLYRMAKEIKQKAIKKLKYERLPDNLVFSFYEKLMGSILFSFCSIEAFANLLIPDDHYHYKQKEKIYFAESKNTIERWEPIEIKLCEIIPEVYKIDSPKGYKVWQDYKILKNIRDRIVHLKTIDQQAGRHAQESIWEVLFKEDNICYPEVAKNLIGYYINKKDEIKFPWFSNIPNYL